MARTWLVVLLALLWAPLEVHCQIEVVSGWEFLSCASENTPAKHSNSHCGDSTCCAWESAQYQLPNSQILVCPVLQYDIVQQV